MTHQEFEPPEQLRDTIKCFWYNKRNFAELPTSFDIVPDGYAEIIPDQESSCQAVSRWFGK